MKPQTGEKVLCKFINRCNKFKLNQCEFRHDLCNKKQQCQFGDKCKYYHPQLQGKISTPKAPKPDGSQSKRKACIFGQNCNKKATCTFSHDLSSGQQAALPKKPKQEVECIYGLKCNKFPLGLCKFKHSGQLPRANPNSEMQAQQKQQQTVQVEEATNYNSEVQQFQESKLCKRFAMGNCQRGDDCQMQHHFSADNSLKRTYYKNYIDQGPQASKIFCVGFVVNGVRIFAIGHKNTLNFYELDTTYTCLKTVCASELAVQAPLNSLFITEQTTKSQQPALIFTTKKSNKLHIYTPIEGKISTKEYVFNEQISGACFFTPQNLLFLSNSKTGLLIEKGNEKKLSSMLKINSSSLDNLDSISVMKKFMLFRESFVVLGTHLGCVAVINEKLQANTINFDNNPVLDVAAASYWEKPFLFVSAALSEKKSQIIAINLLDFSKQTVLEFQQSKASKINSNHNRLFIGVDGFGILIYLLSEFPKLKGRIPLTGQIQYLQCDNQGNLIVVSRDWQRRNSTISIYRLRK